MNQIDLYESQRYYRRGVDFTTAAVDRILDRFRESLGDWLHGALNWPETDYEADLARFIEHTQYVGLNIAPESQAMLRALLEARANNTGAFAELAQRGSQAPRAELQLAAVATNEGQGTDAEVNYGAAPESTFVDGEEVAGPGPETTQSFKAKVRKALEILDPAVSRWWHGPSVGGLIRSRNAWGPLFNVKSYVENERPIIVVDRSFTAGQTAQAIIDESASGLFATSIGVHFRRHRIGRSQSEREFQEWRAQALQEAAAYASTLAEIYYSSLASITPAGDLIVTIADIAEDGFSWQHVLSAIPFLDRLPAAITAVTLKLKGGRKLVLDGPLLKEIKALKKADLHIVTSAVKSSKTPEEAIGKIKKGLETIRDASAKKKPASPKSNLNANKTDVYVSRQPSRTVQYVGITDVFAKRAAAHLRERGLAIERLMSKLSRDDARAVEQALIEIHKLQRDGGTLINKINSIAKKNPTYAKQLDRGYELLRSIGYDG